MVVSEAVAPWLALDDAGPPADEFVGPFPLPGFINSWWAHLGRGEPIIIDHGDTKLPVTLESRVLRIAGESDLTDYHSPLGNEVESLGAKVGALVDLGYRVSLDSLPESSAMRLASGLRSAGVEALAEPDLIATVIELTGGVEYLSTLDKRQRHEVRRKRRRYENQIGPVIIDTDRDGGFERFVGLHRGSPGRKGRFLIGEREGFFRDLHGQPGWRVDELFHRDRAVAALFGFFDGGTYYLYNSAYDNELAEASPGIVLLTHTIERLAGEGCTRFDFLKGDEEYKTRLGACPRQLYRIEA
jgi:CelD/BcsL family acetyltransferase involved in cellulose biosynthesis